MEYKLSMDISKRTKQLLKCPFCDFETKRSTTFDKHVIDKHNITSRDIWNSLHNGPQKCLCGCGCETRWIKWPIGYSKFVIGHNAYKTAMGDSANKIIKKRNETLKKNIESGNVTPWSKGLTKETDKRVASRAKLSSIAIKKSFDEGRTQWNSGLTKKTDERMKKRADDLAMKYKKGECIPWAKGLTKETDERIKNMAKLVSYSHSQKNLRDHLDSMKRLSNEEIKSRIEKSGQLSLVDDLSDYVNDKLSSIKVMCNECKTTFHDSLRHLKYGRCYNCSPGGSAAQNEISTFVKSLNVVVETNKRGVIGKLELDIWIPSKNFAIEYNGLYWHSIVQKPRLYHNHKTELCEKSNVQLFHIFEDEWRDKSDIVKSMITHKLGLTSRKIFARKCTIIEVNAHDRKKFFNENHIDGDVNSKKTFGLIYNGELVAAISVRSPFHKSINKMEISRYCTLRFTNVIGGLSKLVKHTLKEFPLLMTYVDTRHGTGLSYKSIGFKRQSVTSPRFWWTDFHKRYNRFKFRADRSRNMTEQQVSEEAGVVRIWGCSNLVYKINV